MNKHRINPDKLLAAYFSMEIALFPEVKTYSGGLGVLAGDFLKSAADLEIPISGVSLLYNRGYFDQAIENGRQVEVETPFDPRGHMYVFPGNVSIDIEGRTVKVGCARLDYYGRTDHRQSNYFLFTKGHNGNRWDDEITSQLYKEEKGDNRYWRIAQEETLGIGGMRWLHKLAEMDVIDLPSYYHLNEGHAAFAALEHLTKYGYDATRHKFKFTTHTPVEAGHDQFSYEKVRAILGSQLDGIDLEKLAGKDHLNMTRLALSLSGYVNAVAKRHAVVSSAMDVFKGREVDSVTNGVHSFTWTSRAFKTLFDNHISGNRNQASWRKDPGQLARADRIPTDALLQAHAYNKSKLMELVKSSTGVEMNADTFTIGFARRFATYKRGDLILEDLEKLVEATDGKAQLIFAGKAHPKDENGKNVMANVIRHSEGLAKKGISLVFLPNYDMNIGRMLTSGSDLWLNNPQRPLEASGTSGMKAAHNGVPSLSTADGWWDEVPKEGNERRGGWTIGAEPSGRDSDSSQFWAIRQEDAASLYEKLKDEIMPSFKHGEDYANKMRGAIKNASYFNTHRMVEEYIDKAYSK